MYLLDTNACIRFLNNTSPALTTQFRLRSPFDIKLCSVVKAELIYGAYHSTHAAENLRLLDYFFEPFLSLPFDDKCSAVYSRIRNTLAQSGTPIGPNDLMIAATALANNVTLVTANTREFDRVIGLSLENWEIIE